MNERNQKINSKWNIVDNKNVVYIINIDKQYMRAEQEESEVRLAVASLCQEKIEVQKSKKT